MTNQQASPITSKEKARIHGQVCIFPSLFQGGRHFLTPSSMSLPAAMHGGPASDASSKADESTLHTSPRDVKNGADATTSEETPSEAAERRYISNILRARHDAEHEELSERQAKDVAEMRDLQRQKLGGDVFTKLAQEWVAKEDEESKARVEEWKRRADSQWRRNVAGTVIYLIAAVLVAVAYMQGWTSMKELAMQELIIVQVMMLIWSA